MRRILILLACAGVLAATGCTNGSRFPDPTGKGSIRAINAMPGSPVVDLLIEERSIGSVNYKNSTTPALWDDFDYVFNFEAFFPGDAERRRVASTSVKVEKDKEHIFLLTGNVTAPTVTVLTDDIRVFDGTETVFGARVLNAINGVGDIDVYIDPAGTAPQAGQQRATLSFGEIMAPLDLAEGDYVITLTAPGDVNTIFYQSDTESFLAQTDIILAAFDGDGNDTGPVALRALDSGGGVSVLPDIAFPSTIRFIHATRALPTVDIYDDIDLTNRIVADHAFGDASADVPVSLDLETFRYTTAGDTAAILFENGFTASPGTHSHFIVIGDIDNLVATTFVPDRASVTTFAKLRLYHAALDNESVDFYLNVADVPLTEDSVPVVRALLFSLGTPVLQQIAGSYDAYLTVAGSLTVLAGPVRIDLANGDIVDLIALDTADPNVTELRSIPVP